MIMYSYIETCWRVASQKRDLLNGDHKTHMSCKMNSKEHAFCNWAMKYQDGISNSQNR